MAHARGGTFFGCGATAISPVAEWERAAARVLRQSEDRVRVVSACTPANLEAEIEALALDFARSNPREPRFVYRSRVDVPPPELLDQLADDLAGRSWRGRLMATRARELALEARLVRSMGTAAFADLARQRYSGDAQASALAARWCALRPADDARPHRSDDAGDPLSLLSLMRAEVGAQRMAVKVKVTRLAALAATGRGVILVAPDRALSAHDAKRTVHHEVFGHALPRWRAAQSGDPLLDAGTAGASDDQEGYALALEEEAGLLDDGRRRQLGLRHHAAEGVQDGASFVDTVAGLRDRGANLEAALRIAARVHRGGGLAREIVYLPALLRAQPLLKSPLRQVLARGRVAIGHAREIEERTSAA